MKRQKFIPLVVIAAGLLAYCNTFTVPFFFDDVESIPENPTIRHLWPLWQCLSPPHRGGLTVEGRPLINLSLAVNYALGGYNVWGYHAWNLTVHILAGLTLLGVVRRTLLQPRLRGRFGAAANELALAVAVLWTVHPLHTESVTYVIQRAESTMGLFYLLTLYCFIRGVESRWPRLWYSLCVGACALGMASKEVMVSAPLMVLLYDRTFVSGTFREALRRRWLLYLGLVGAWVLLALILIPAGNFATASRNAQNFGLTRWRYFWTQPGVILYYLRLSVWPYPLCLNHTWWFATTWERILPPAAVLASLLGATAWALRRNSVWGFAGAFFFLVLAPSSSLIPLHNPIYEHRMYLSLVAVVMTVVLGLYALAGRRSFWVIIPAAMALAFLTWQHNLVYRNDIALWSDAVAKFPDNAGVHDSLAVALGDAGRFQEALQHWDEALRIQPDFPAAHINLGVVLMRMGRVQDAIGHYRQALRVAPNNEEAHYNLGQALWRTGEDQAAIEQWKKALRIKPDRAETHYNLGIALVQTGKRFEAIWHFRQAVQIRPDYAEAYNNLGATLWRAGRIQEARRYYEQALHFKPDYAEAHNNLGSALMALGRVPEAMGYWEQALRLSPDYAEAHYNLGSALLGLGKVAEAIGHYEQALRLKPDYAKAHFHLGTALEQMGRVQEAIQHYKLALQINPGMAEAQKNLVRLRAAQ